MPERYTHQSIVTLLSSSLLSDTNPKIVGEVSDEVGVIATVIAFVPAVTVQVAVSVPVETALTEFTNEVAPDGAILMVPFRSTPVNGHWPRID